MQVGLFVEAGAQLVTAVTSLPLRAASTRASTISELAPLRRVCLIASVRILGGGDAGVKDSNGCISNIELAEDVEEVFLLQKTRDRRGEGRYCSSDGFPGR